MKGNDPGLFVRLLEEAPENMNIQDALGKCCTEIRFHDKILAAVSGGSDSDDMADLIIRCGGKEKTTFVFFNTGLEYDATKRQLKKLEEKYEIEIQVLNPIKPIPVCVREYGVPFWSKFVSDYISRLQRHGFRWEDKPLEELLREFPRCKAALRWWCNDWPKSETGKESKFNIAYTPWLKEFMLANPPDFKISAKCCTYAKKDPVKKYIKSGDFDLNCTGIRKAEGGKRASAYKSCYTQSMEGPDQYRPLFWFTDSDKKAYDEHYGIKHSDCYEVWGMKRTGCAGCPFGKEFESELALVKEYEPKFYNAVNKIFGVSYEYTRQYLKFREQMNAQAKSKTKGGDLNG